MIAQHRTLLEDGGWRRWGRSVEQRAGLGEDPRIADRAAGDAHAVHSRLAKHRDAGGGGEQVARSDHRAGAGVPLHAGQKRPVGRPHVALSHGAAVHGDGRDPPGECAVEDRPEAVLALRGVVEAAAHLEGDGHMGGRRVADALDDLESRVGNTQEVAAAATAEHLLDGAAEIDVDDIVARGHEPPGGGGEVVGVRAHELAADGVLVVRDGEPGEIAPVRADLRHEPIEQHLPERVRGAVPAREHAHGQVAVAGQRRLQERRVEHDGAEMERGGHGRSRT